MMHAGLLLITVAFEVFVAFLAVTTWTRLGKSSESLPQVLLACLGLNLVSHSVAMALLVMADVRADVLEAGIFFFEAIGYRFATSLNKLQCVLLSLFANGATILVMLQQASH